MNSVIHRLDIPLIWCIFNFMKLKTDTSFVGTTPEADLERLDRFQSLQAGQYWRALQDVVEEGIDEGTSYMKATAPWPWPTALIRMIRCFGRAGNKNWTFKYRCTLFRASTL